MKQIYFDYAAGTPLDPSVLDKMLPFLTDSFGNPASATHQYGKIANDAIEYARRQISETIGANHREIVFTSGATESNNLALKGLSSKHVITSKTEHRAVLDVCGWLGRSGCEVAYLDPEISGEITVESVKKALKTETTLVSIQAVNNETGVINPIREIGELTKAHGVKLHVDGAQAIGKIAIDVESMNIDLLSLSSHKAYGPKGIGALYVRRKPRVKLDALILGGGHERGMRSGTLPTHQIVGMGEAFERVGNTLIADNERYLRLKACLTDALSPENTRINGLNCVAGILNVSFAGADVNDLLSQLSNFAVATGSACSSAQHLISNEPSHVLKSMKVAPEYLNSSVRISFGRMTTMEDVTELASALSTLSF